MKNLLFITSIFLSLNSYAQTFQLSDKSEVSIITCGPGNDELYEAFGHSALRIVDPVQGIDVVYNYGMFDLEGPNFYLNFVRGDMLYKLGRYPFNNFLYGYRIDERWVKEQILNLNQEEKQHFFHYLEDNVIPENASYLYDPYFNNCSSILRDLIKKVHVFEGVTKNKNTLRQLMSEEIPWNTWGSFGIHIALGNKLDKEATYEQYMYLPDHLYNSLHEAQISKNGTKAPLVKNERTILNFDEKKQEISFFNPFLIFTLFLLITGFITYKNYKNNTRSKWFDFILFFITGLIGTLIVFLWFFTNHSTAPNNFNFLWAFAPNLVVSFYMLKNKVPHWINTYTFILLVFLLILIIVWILKIQVFSIAVIPILILLAVRYFYLYKINRN
jgi:hypothetical protein